MRNSGNILYVENGKIIINTQKFADELTNFSKSKESCIKESSKTYLKNFLYDIADSFNTENGIELDNGLKIDSISTFKSWLYASPHKEMGIQQIVNSLSDPQKSILSIIKGK